MARIEKWDEVHGNQAPDEKMMAFLDSATDQYAILQLRRSEDTVYERFSSMRELERMGLEPDIDHYEVVYTAPLLPYKDQNTMLEELYAKFNVSRPDDFTGHIGVRIPQCFFRRASGKCCSYMSIEFAVRQIISGKDTITADFFHADNEIHSLPDQVCKGIKTFVTTVCHKDGIITILMKTIRSVQ